MGKYIEKRTTLQILKADRLLLDESPHYQDGIPLVEIVGALLRMYAKNPQLIDKELLRS